LSAQLSEGFQAMDRVRKLELIERSLGLRHKIKVHESMKPPENHEDLALMLLAKWEFEDELRAIEELLSESRQKNISAKRKTIVGDDGVPGKVHTRNKEK
jgi:hypothetical protein